MLVLARHGECVANTERRYVGRSESPLTERGRRQVERLARVLAADAGLELSRVVSSPLGRARETAEVVARVLGEERDTSLPVVVDERFAELDYGELDGSPISEGGRHTPARWHEDPAVAVARGESIEQAASRVRPACEELFAELSGRGASSVLVVSHVLPIKLAVSWALGVPSLTVWRMSLAVASLTRIATSGERPTLERYNEHGFLGEDLSPPIWR